MITGILKGHCKMKGHIRKTEYKEIQANILILNIIYDI